MSDIFDIRKQLPALKMLSIKQTFQMKRTANFFFAPIVSGYRDSTVT